MMISKLKKTFLVGSLVTSLFFGAQSTVSFAQTVNPISRVVSTAYESGHVVCTGPCNLWGYMISSKTTSGFLMIFDAVSAPTAGSIPITGTTMLECVPITAGTPFGELFTGSNPVRTVKGLYFAYSSGSDCTTLTYSTLAWFQVEAQ